MNGDWSAAGFPGKKAVTLPRTCPPGKPNPILRRRTVPLITNAQQEGISGKQKGRSLRPLKPNT